MDNMTFPRFLGRVTSSHLVTYFVAGILALQPPRLRDPLPIRRVLLPDAARSAPSGSPRVRPCRSSVGSSSLVALYPFRSVFLADRRGWLKLWGLLLGPGDLFHGGRRAGIGGGHDLHEDPSQLSAARAARDPSSDAGLFGPAHHVASAPAPGVGGDHGNRDAAGDADERRGRISFAPGGLYVGRNFSSASAAHS